MESLPGAGTLTAQFDGYLKAMVTGVTTATGSEEHSFDVRIVSRVSYGTTGFEQVLAPTVLSPVSAGVVTVSLNDTTDVLDTDVFTGGGLVNVAICILLLLQVLNYRSVLQLTFHKELRLELTATW